MTYHPYEVPRPRLHRFEWLRELAKTVFMLMAIYALVELATPRFYVDGRSMQPNFYDGQRLIVSRINYLFSEPQRGDIVVLNKPHLSRALDEPPLIKRIIGLPGETIEIRNQQVYINGVELNEPYIKEPCNQSHCADAVYELKPNEYFVMGDNRNNSSDSRGFGPITRDAIIGEALIRYWPPSDWGLVWKIGFPGE